MSRIVKKISSPYLVVAANGDPTVFTVGEQVTNNAEFTINGNLTVRGANTSISTVNTSINDNFVTLNAGFPATALPTLNAGLEVSRGNQPPAVLRWNEALDRWELSNDGVHFSVISTQIGGSYLTVVFDDKAPYLGGNLDVNGFTIRSDNNVVIAPDGNIQIDSPIQFQQNVTPPAVVPGYSVLYAQAPGGGGTGVYVTSSAAVETEMVSKRKAVVFSLIF